MLADSLLPIPFWAEAVNTACYVLNRVLVTKPQNKTPYELLICNSPSISFMRPFGCPLTILNTLDSLGKFDGKFDEGYLIGYSTTRKAFRVYNKRTKRVEENMHIDFLEDQPNVTGTGPNWMFDLDFLTNLMNYIPVSVENQVNVDAEVVATAMDEPQDNILKRKRNIASQKRATQATSTNKLSTVRSYVSTATTPYVSAASTPTGANAEKQLSFVYLGGQITYYSYDDENVGAVVDFNNMDDTINVSPIPTLKNHKNHPKDQILGDPKSAVQTRGKIQKASSTQQALVCYISKQNRTNHKDHQNYLLACFLSQEEPKNISQALQDESWVEAMQEELLQFKLQEVWILVDLPSRKKAIGTKWVFKNKWDERSIVVNNKDRLVEQGFRHEEGIYYDEVFAPVARIEAIRLFLAFASYMGFTVYQMDVKSAFLYGTIEEEVYVHQPPGFVDPAHPNKVYKVIKALYGLHQAPRAWYETLSSFLMENGFRRGTIDKTLFIKKKKSDIMLVQVYVDDIIFGSTKKSMCTEFEDCMHKRFQMSSMGELTFFLGLQVKQQPDGIFISQDKYVADILKKFDFWSIRTATTPIESNKPLVKDEDGEDVDVHVYRSMIGSLMYLTASRPDIMFAVCAYARFQVTQKTSHLHVVKRIFRYLKHQPKLGLWYPRDSPFELESFSDSDYAGASFDRKSTTGGCQFLGRRLISWQCKKQTIVANFLLSSKIDYVELLILLLISMDLRMDKCSAGDSTLIMVWEAVDQGEGSLSTSQPPHIPVDPILSTSQHIFHLYSSPPIPSPPPHSPPHLPHQSPPFSPSHFSPPSSYEAPLPKGNTSGSVEDSMQLKELMVLKVLISESEGEESEDQGRKIQDIDDDPLVSLAVKLCQKLLLISVSKQSSDLIRAKYRRRQGYAKRFDTGLDAEEEINTGREEINTGIEEVSTGSTKVDSGTASKRGQREGKAPMVKEDIQATHKTKEQMRQEEAGLEEAINCKFIGMKKLQSRFN
ncbi:putative ribonuclease H-like domain-containing protein [Tanacetum coccineum]